MHDDRSTRAAPAHATDAMRTLWARIAEHRLHALGGDVDFASRLATEHGWSRDDALAAIEEYRRFVFLAVIARDVATPSDAVDEVWHLHLQYTRDYWQRFCPHVLGVDLHHEPSRGGPTELARYREAYAQTLARYERHFGPPPERFWPGTHERFGAAHAMRRVDRRRFFIVPRPAFAVRRVARRALAAILALAAPGVVVAALPGDPLDWTGPSFLKLYLVAMLVAFVASVWLRRRALDTGEPGRRTGLARFEIAYLGGGPTRAIDAGVTELLHRKAASVDIGGRTLALAADAPPLEPPLEQLAAAIRSEGRVQKLPARAAAFVESLQRSVVARALSPDAERAWRARWQSALPPLLVVAFGLAKIAVGQARGKPVGFLVLLAIVTGVFALAQLVRRPLRTSAGDAALRELKARHATTMRAPSGDDLALAVALAGTGVLASTIYADYHRARASNGGGGDSSSSGGDGGCSGGGGCGGCGGGD